MTTMAAGAVGAPAFAASAGTAAVSGTRIVFQAGSGKANYVTVTRSGRTVTIDDQVAIKPGKGCKNAGDDKTRVRCTTSRNPTQVSLSLGDRDDAADNKTSIPVNVSGGTGNDALTGGAGNDRIAGDSGRDRIWGAAGNDRLYGNDGHDFLYAGDGTDHVDGGAGNDKLYGDNGNDTMDGDRGNDEEYGGDGDDTFDQNRHFSTDTDLLVGGAGQDLVTYERRTENLTLSPGVPGLSGASDYTRFNYDSENYVTTSFEKDTISADVENMTGGGGDDWLRGSRDDNVLRGGGGSDLLHGGLGNDTVHGDGTTFLPARGMQDEIFGGGGQDRLSGGEDDDYLNAMEDGEQETDHLDGGPSGSRGNVCDFAATVDVAVHC